MKLSNLLTLFLALFGAILLCSLAACRQEGPTNELAERLTDKIWQIQSLNFTKAAESPTDTMVSAEYASPGAPLVFTKSVDGNIVSRDTIIDYFEEWIFTSRTYSDGEIDVNQAILPYFRGDTCRPRVPEDRSLGGIWNSIPASDRDRFVEFSISMIYPFILPQRNVDSDDLFGTFRGNIIWQNETSFMIVPIENDLNTPNSPYEFQILVSTIQETGCPNPSYCADRMVSCVNGRYDWSICRCNCDDGWGGSACDTEIRCFGTPCQNGRIILDDCSCLCDEGWTGPDCSELIQTTPVCDSTTISCVNGTPTLDSDGLVCYCECEVGWAGPDCSVSTMQSPTAVFTLAGNGLPGMVNAQGINAQFDNPVDVVSDSMGNIYVADDGNRLVRKIDPTGQVTTHAGSGGNGFFDGFALSAEFGRVSGLAIDDQGNIYVADEANHAIRKITPQMTVVTIAGNGSSGQQDGALSSSTFSRPRAIYWDKHKIFGFNMLLVGDQNGTVIRLINLDNNTVFTILGSAGQGYENGFASSATFHTISAITTHPLGYLYLCDRGNQAIRQIRILESIPDVVSTYSGLDTNGVAIGVPAGNPYYNPTGLAYGDPAELFVADAFNHRIRALEDNNRINGIDRYVAGSQTGVRDFNDGEPIDARFDLPTALWTDHLGRLIVVDKGNHAIRVIPQP